jgi:hypothetical protein
MLNLEKEWINSNNNSKKIIVEKDYCQIFGRHRKNLTKNCSGGYLLNTGKALFSVLQRGGFDKQNPLSEWFSAHLNSFVISPKLQNGQSIQF